MKRVVENVMGADMQNVKVEIELLCLIFSILTNEGKENCCLWEYGFFISYEQMASKVKKNGL